MPPFIHFISAAPSKTHSSFSHSTVEPKTMDEQPSNRIDQKKRSKEASKTKKEPPKVKYISSPIMVNARSETEFRAVVQELTGKDSGNPSPSQFPTTTASVAEQSRARERPTPGTDSISNVLLDNVYSRELDDDILWREFSKDT
ncbi:hypothetical protein Ancab_023998 [Ancistrocladus abbreviatus]